MGVIDKGIGGKPTNGFTFPVGVEVKILDKTYKMYPRAQVLSALKEIPIEKYVAETHDCDDFAKEAVVAVQHKLPGCPIGFVSGRSVRGNPHAVVMFFANNDAGKLQRYYYDSTGRTELPFFEVNYIIM